jgi:hypothetical protein
MSGVQFLDKILQSEAFSYNKTFSKEFVYSDAHGSPTTITCANSDFGFAGLLG